MGQRLNLPKRSNLFVLFVVIALVGLSAFALKGVSNVITHAQASAPQPLRIAGKSFQATNGPHATHGVTIVSGDAVGGIDTNDWVRYDNVNLSGYTHLAINAAVVNATAQIDVYIDARESGANILGGIFIGSFSNMGTNGSYTAFTTRSIQLSRSLTGAHKVYLKFYPADRSTSFGLLNYNWLQFGNVSSSNADLQSLAVSTGRLTPAFNKAVTGYTLIVPTAVTQVAVTARVANPGYATLNINGKHQNDNTSLNVSVSHAKSIIITVTAENGTPKSYTITVEQLASGKDYYVDAKNGSDSNSGTRNSPWKTLPFACSHVPANQGAILHLLAGTHRVTSQCLLPPKTSLVGAGVSQTTITPTMTYDPQGQTGNFGPNFFAIRTTDTVGITLSNFKMEGQINPTTRAHGGILAYKVSNLLLHDVELNNFNYTAALVTSADNAHIYNATINESGYTLSKNGTLGNIEVGDFTNSSVHDVKIRESKGAYGIKGAKYASDPGVDVFTNVRFYRLDIKLKQMGAWNDFASSNFPIELWNSNTQGVEIFQSWFNGTLSIPSSDAHRNQPNSVRIHHNTFVGDSTTIGAAYTYFIEASTDYMEIDHNTFVNAIYPIASFGGTVVGMNIHHNSFTNVYGVSVLNFKAVKDLRFNYNMVTINANVRAEERGHLPILQLSGSVSDNITMTNNILSDTAEFNDGKMVSLSGTATVGSNVTIDRNAFHNWKLSGTNATAF